MAWSPGAEWTSSVGSRVLSTFPEENTWPRAGQNHWRSFGRSVGQVGAWSPWQCKSPFGSWQPTALGRCHESFYRCRSSFQTTLIIFSWSSELRNRTSLTVSMSIPIFGWKRIFASKILHPIFWTSWSRSPSWMDPRFFHSDRSCHKPLPAFSLSCGTYD